MEGSALETETWGRVAASAVHVTAGTADGIVVDIVASTVGTVAGGIAVAAACIALVDTGIAVAGSAIAVGTVLLEKPTALDFARLQKHNATAPLLGLLRR